MSSVLQRGAETKKATSSEAGDDIATRGLLRSILDPPTPIPLIPATQAKALAPGMVGIVNPLLFPETVVEKWWASASPSRLAREMGMLRETNTSPSLSRRLSFLGRPEETLARPSDGGNRDKALVGVTASIVGVVGALAEFSIPEQAAPLEEKEEVHHTVDKDLGRSPISESKESSDEMTVENARTTPLEEDSPALAADKLRSAEEEESKINDEEGKDSASGGNHDEGEVAPPVTTDDLVLEEGGGVGNARADSEVSGVACKKDPAKCTHSTKHVSLSKCSSALKKKSVGLEGAGDWLLCLQCGRPWSDPASAEVHASRSNHPVMLRCRDGSLICFKCDSADVSKSVAAQMEPVLSDMDKIRCMVRTKLGSAALNESKTSGDSSKSAPPTQELMIKLTEAKEDDPSVSSSGGAQPLGLKNLGNTCFFNSSLQVLAQSQRVQAALKNTSGLALASALGKCLREIAGTSAPSNPVVVVERKTKKGSISSSRGGPAISPSALFSAVCKVAPHFSGFEQQDAQELMTFLLGGIEDEARPNNNHDPSQSENVKAAKPTMPVPGVSWKMKHAEFWFGERAKDVIQRTPADEDDDSGYVAEHSLDTEEDKDEDVEKGMHIDAQEEDGGVETELKVDVNDRAISSSPEEKVHEAPLNLTKDVFQVDLESVVRCDDCDAETIRKETQYMLSLALAETTPAASTATPNSNAKGVKGGRASNKGAAYSASASSSGPPETLKSCLNRFFAPERLLRADNNGFQCDKCARRKGQKAEQAQVHDATRRLRLVEVRDVLVLHFKRFHQTEGRKGGMRAVKIDTHVQLEQVLQLPDGQGEMELVGIVEHLGSSLHGGHYVAYVRSSSTAGKGPAAWFRCSDDSVGKVSESHVFDSAQAYMALYERR